jgi:hypothetical protein
MQIELELKAEYPAPGIDDKDALELELHWLRREIGMLLGKSASLQFTLKAQEKDGKWKTLRS